MAKNLILTALVSNLAQAAMQFFDCETALDHVDKDEDALPKLQRAIAAGGKLSSACLTYLLERNFLQTSQHLIEEYYPSTTIDTELLVKSAMREVEKKQNQVLFDALKRSRGNSWHREKPPLVY